MKPRLLGFPKMFGLLFKSFDITGRVTWLLTGREGSAIEAAVGTERAAAVVDVEREEKVRRTGDKKEYPSLVRPSSPVTIIVGIISLITIY